MAVKVLIVDDDITLRDMYAERLKAEGFEAEIAGNGDEGIEKAKSSRTDVILLDIMMPKTNGFVALEKLKQDATTKDIPIIMLTALIQNENKTRSVTSGADDYIVKSETMPGEVIEKINKVIAKRKPPEK